MPLVPEYEEARAVAQELYANAKPVECPALGVNVHFTAEGFGHILYRNSRTDRELSSQMERFALLPKAIKLISIANIYQEYEIRHRRFEAVHDGKRKYKPKTITYWGIIAIFEGQKFKVVLRKVGSGEVHFWSVIPNWTTSKERDAKLVRK